MLIPLVMFRNGHIAFIGGIMTDEQIIIDGCNVSECLFYQSNFEEDYDVKIKHFCSNWHNSCESPNNSNCYFKQLARKTQECEKLKKQLMQKSEVDMFFNTPIEGWSSDPCGICKFKNCLTEIKEIAEENIRIADLEGLNGVYRRGLAKQIIQKISECEVDND